MQFGKRIAVLSASFLLGCSTSPPIIPPSRTIQDGELRQHMVVFVHGATGDAVSTWSWNDEFWPKQLADDLGSEYGVFVASYFSPAMAESQKVTDLARHLNSELISNKVLSYSPGESYREIVFVSHSLGGIIALNAMLLDPALYRETHVSLFASFSTPWAGSEFAELASLMSRNPSFRSIIPLEKNSFLAFLDVYASRAYRDTVFVCAYETLSVRIVSDVSASLRCGQKHSRGFADNHSSIAKPHAGHEYVHNWLMENIKKYSASASNPVLTVAEKKIYDAVYEKRKEIKSRYHSKGLRRKSKTQEMTLSAYQALQDAGVSDPSSNIRTSHRIWGHEAMAEFSGILADLYPGQRTERIKQGLIHVKEAQKLIEAVGREADRGDSQNQLLRQELNTHFIPARLAYRHAVLLGTLVCYDDDFHFIAQVKDLLEQVSCPLLDEWPPDTDPILSCAIEKRRYGEPICEGKQY